MNDRDLVERFDQIERKLSRGNELLDLLEAELELWDVQNTSRPRIGLEGDFELDQPPATSTELSPQWEITFGEAAYQARSALDQIVAAAAAAQGVDIARHNGGFPISMDKNDYYRSDRRGRTFRDRRLAGIAPRVQSHIDSVQPFHAEVPRRHPLAVVNNVCNADKHRLGKASRVALRGSALAVYVHSRNLFHMFDLGIAETREITGVALEDRDALLSVFPESKVESALDVLRKQGIADEEVDLQPIIRQGVCFGEDHVRTFQMAEAFDYIRGAVLGPIRELVLS
ncbi:MAG: hypothetical protein ACI39C_07505 [Dietzia sp.]